MLHILHTYSKADGDQASGLWLCVKRKDANPAMHILRTVILILRYTLIVSENFKGKMFRYSMLFILMIAASVSAFSMAPAKHMKPQTRLRAVLTADELESILMRGHECEKSECSLDDVNSLIVELQEQQHKLYERVQNIDNMIKALETMNSSNDRNVDEVRNTVRAIFRVFAMSPKAKVISHPTGYAGNVGAGPTDAYKALDPKPWKPKSP